MADQEPQAEMEAEFYEGDSLDQKGRYVAQEDGFLGCKAAG